MNPPTLWPGVTVRALLISLICLLRADTVLQAQHATNTAPVLSEKQLIALSLLEMADTLSPSTLWPNVKAKYFFDNVRKNILYPAKINQGSSTNFCGYAAMTHLMITYYPEVYTRHLLALYDSGKTEILHKTLIPSAPVRQAAGTLTNKGELDLLHADQLWFLTLADNFKGYMNIVDKKYNPGDENKIWAGTNYAKFNRMMKSFSDSPLTMAGSDFIRPAKKSFYEYISQQLDSGIVVLYVNSKFLYPHKFSLFKLRAPTHFIVLYEMREIEGLIDIKYWDYGLKTEQLITRKRLKKLIFGVTTISIKTHEPH